MKRLQCDVVVVGCGVAGLSAALSALEGGASVIILERAPEEERGGNTRWTEALLRVTPDGDPAPDFEQGYVNNPGFHILPEFLSATMGSYENWPDLVKAAPMSDAEVLDAFLSGVRPGLDWLATHGVRLDQTSFPMMPPLPPLTAVYGGGLAIVETLCPAVEAHGGTILYRTTAAELLRDDDNRITGIRATDGDDHTVIIDAPNVVLACGGFEGNPEMRARYLGPNSRYDRPLARGGWYHKGEGIQMALAAGAAGSGDYSDCHREPVDPRSNQPEALVNAFPLGIVVNQNGDRFMDEASSDPGYFQEQPSYLTTCQPGGIGYFIYDSKIAEVANWKLAMRTDQPPIEAATLSELADKLKIPADNLERTAAAFNAACPDDAPLDTSSFDGRSTSGLMPPKTNFARTISEGPFGAYPMTSGIVFTYGALKVSRNSEVVNKSGVVIPGLYAAGETVGIIYGVYVAATSVLRGLVFGRLAGSHAATQSKQRTASVASAPENRA